MPTAMHYAVTVFAWGLTWTAIHLQVGQAPLAVSIFYRFTLAGAVLLLAVGLRRRFPAGGLKVHFWLAAQGLCLFCVNFLFLYRATSLIPSGLVAVIFSMASLFNAANAWGFMHQVPSRRVFIAAAMGIAGLTCLFWPELQWSQWSAHTGQGLIYAIAGTYSFSLGNLIGVRLKRLDVDVFPGNACAMGYGTVATGLCIGIQGLPWVMPTTVTYWGAMAFLVLIGSIAAFGSFLTLIRRLGAARAGYVTVVFPVVALLASTWLEGYTWTPLAIAGALLAMAGNGVMFWRTAGPEPAPPAGTPPRPSTRA